MKKMPLLLVWGVVLGITGCSLDPEVIQKEKEEEVRRQTKVCQSMGVQPRTKQMVDCIFKLRAEEEARRSPTIIPIITPTQPTLQPPPTGFSCFHQGNNTYCR